MLDGVRFCTTSPAKDQPPGTLAISPPTNGGAEGGRCFHPVLAARYLTAGEQMRQTFFLLAAGKVARLWKGQLQMYHMRSLTVRRRACQRCQVRDLCRKQVVGQARAGPIRSMRLRSWQRDG